jgi:HAD superfamily hydrolase (TIGR01458 family)
VSPLRALLFDIDGTIMIEGRIRPEAPEVLSTLRKRGFLVRFVTNITTRSPQTLCRELTDSGIAVSAEEIYTPLSAVCHFLHAQSARKIYPLVSGDAAAVLADFEVDSERCEWVVIGDAGSQFSYDRLNRAFQLIREGARLISLSPNRACEDAGAWRLDCGTYVAALELATGQQAVLVGKPAALYFTPLLERLAVEPAESLMVGDSVATDIAGAANVGMRAILVADGRGARVADPGVPVIESLHPLASIRA